LLTTFSVCGRHRNHSAFDCFVDDTMRFFGFSLGLVS
jgi:hypothetical protein